MAMKILIAEDNALVALDLEQQVTDAGHIVVGIADTACEAIALVMDRGADLALMDVSLADGSCGIDVALVLKERFGVPSVFVTATLPNQWTVSQVGIGHLSKPYSEEEVVAAIKAVEATLRGEPPRSLSPRLCLFA
jgi:two-component system, response regulator PdtaR